MAIQIQPKEVQIMYQSFEVRNYRCFQCLTINDLARVNLIAGMNNVGKTALLEALFLHCGAYNPELSLRVNAFRGIEVIKLEPGQWAETPWDSLFSEFDVAKNIELIGTNEKTDLRVLKLKVVHDLQELSSIGQYIQHTTEKPESITPSLEIARVLELEYKEKTNPSKKHYLILDPKGPPVRIVPIPPPPPFQAIFLGARFRTSSKEDTERFRKLQVQGEEDILLQTLKIIEPRLTRLAVVVEAGEPMLEGDIGMKGRRFVPLPLMGEGTARLASLTLAISSASGGVVLVDEIENGLHHSILQKIWKAIGKVARHFDTQVFATTHSLECIIAAHRAFSDSEVYDFRLHRLENVRGTIRAETYDQESLEAAIETGLEVR